LLFAVGHVGDMPAPKPPEDILPGPKGTRNPLVIVGAGITGAVLCCGFLAFKSGNTNMSQQMMRARILAQGATVALMVGSSSALVLPTFLGGEVTTPGSDSA